MNPSDLLGLLAGSCVLLTFSVRSLCALRGFAIASNLLFIAYAASAQLLPILVLHGLLLPLNVLRLWEQRKPPDRDRQTLGAQQR
jgi:CRP/FNR family cyclic AMP-dependent transcriptional regulator